MRVRIATTDYRELYNCSQKSHVFDCLSYRIVKAVNRKLNEKYYSNF